MRRGEDRIVTAGDMRRLEAAAVRDGMTYARLMNRAGEAAAQWIIENRFPAQVGGSCKKYDKSTVLILCGKGNNGGDGLVIARMLHECYPLMSVRVMLLFGEPTASPAKEVYADLHEDETLSIYVADPQTPPSWGELCRYASKADLIVEAIYGIGFRGVLSPYVKAILKFARALDTFVVSVDIPAGMNADDGTWDKAFLRPNVTLTFTALKPSLAYSRSAAQCGKIVRLDVGIEGALTQSYCSEPHCIEQADVCEAFLPRPANSHKGTFGKVFALCGSYGMAGAALLAGKAALRCGVGLLHLCLPQSIYPIAAGQLWEAVYHPLDETSDGGLAAASLKTLLSVAKEDGVVLIGPGLSQNKRTASVVIKWLSTLTLPTVIDADGLNILSKHIDVLKAMGERGTPVVLTPHPAEAARLLECTVADIEADRFDAAKRLAALCGGVAVLKGHRTVIASANGALYLNETGCSGLATGGSGDVLAGMIAAFAATGVSLLQAAVAAVYLHGLAAERVSARLSETGMLPTDLLEELPLLLSQFEKRE